MANYNSCSPSQDVRRVSGLAAHPCGPDQPSLRISRQLLFARLADTLLAHNGLEGAADYTETPLEEIPGDEDFLSEAFRRILGSPPDLEGLQHFLGVLRSHPRSFVLQYLQATADTARENTAAASDGAGSGGPAEVGPVPEIISQPPGTSMPEVITTSRSVTSGPFSVPGS